MRILALLALLALPASAMDVVAVPSADSFTGTLGVANGGTGGATAATARTAIGVAASGANVDVTSLRGPVQIGNTTAASAVSTITVTGALQTPSLAIGSGITASSAPILHVCGPIIVGTLATGTTFLSFTPDAAITLVRITVAVEVAGIGGAGDIVKCNNAAGTGVTVTSAAAAAAGVVTTAVGSAAIAYQAVVSCHIDSTATTRPIANACLEYVSQ